MVGRILLIISLLQAPGQAATDPGAAATSATPTAQAPLEPYKPEANRPGEDFFVVSIISLPFTALWSVVGAAALASFSQKQFPPNFSNDTILATAAVAIGASLTIGLLSVSWGKGHSSSAASIP